MTAIEGTSASGSDRFLLFDRFPIKSSTLLRERTLLITSTTRYSREFSWSDALLVYGRPVSSEKQVRERERERERERRDSDTVRALKVHKWRNRAASSWDLKRRQSTRNSSGSGKSRGFSALGRALRRALRRASYA
jgi:hypothetical protein